MAPRAGLVGMRGAVLTDVIVGLSILAIATGGIFAGFKGSLTAWTAAQQFSGEQHNARLVLDWTVRRVRAAGNGYAGPHVTVAGATEIVFYGDTNGDGRVECYRIYRNASEEVVYANITEVPAVPDCSTGTGQPLTASVEARSLAIVSLDLRYFDGSPGGGVELARPVTDPLTRALIRRVLVTIQVRGQQSATVFSMSSEVYIRPGQ
ncbi:MAG: hypothetical protein QN131_12110 [Armatimonadota bacterium]|nr:hypothetical protein [Armatimonadota bacterium]MDR7550661.1 hypothetical protein [Armatimonadota bacterium]